MSYDLLIKTGRRVDRHQKMRGRANGPRHDSIRAMDDSARLFDFRKNPFAALPIERVGDARHGAPRQQALAGGDGPG